MNDSPLSHTETDVEAYGDTLQTEAVLQFKGVGVKLQDGASRSDKQRRRRRQQLTDTSRRQHHILTAATDGLK